MPKAAILCFDDAYASVVGGFADMLQVANAFLGKQGVPVSARFEWHFVSRQGGLVRASNGLPLATEPLAMANDAELVFIPSLHYRGWLAFQDFLQQQTDLCEWLVRRWQAGAWISANCTGTFLLAESGLLDRRTATTTWWLERHFRKRFPLVNLQMRPAVTEDERLMCGGAQATFLLQAVRILRHFVGEAIATQCARSMLIDLTQTLQTPLQPLIADQSHRDPLVQAAQKWLQDHMTGAVRIRELAENLAVSERTLIRRFNAVLGQSPLTYLQHLRIDTARALLESGDLSSQQIAHLVGYGDMSSFSRLFKARVGFTPGAYRARFQCRGEA